MSTAKPHTTMSFRPMDRVLILDCSADCNIEKSLTVTSMRQNTLRCKVKCQKKSGAQWRKVAAQAGCRLVFRHLRRIPNHLLERGEIFEIALAA